MKNMEEARSAKNKLKTLLLLNKPKWFNGIGIGGTPEN